MDNLGRLVQLLEQRVHELESKVRQLEAASVQWTCDGCGRYVGKHGTVRFHCLQCRDFDLCRDCRDKEFHNHHSFVMLHF